jgi:hypothetical protein
MVATALMGGLNSGDFMRLTGLKVTDDVWRWLKNVFFNSVRNTVKDNKKPFYLMSDREIVEKLEESDPGFFRRKIFGSDNTKYVVQGNKVFIAKNNNSFKERITIYNDMIRMDRIAGERR